MSTGNRPRARFTAYVLYRLNSQIHLVRTEWREKDRPMDSFEVWMELLGQGMPSSFSYISTTADISQNRLVDIIVGTGVTPVSVATCISQSL